VKPALLALAFAALFVGVVFVGGRLLGVWNTVEHPQASARPPLPTVGTTLAEEVADREETARKRRADARRARRHDAMVRWRREANALCVDAAREARALAREHDQPISLDDVAALGELALEGERRFLDQLANLAGPRAGRSRIRQMLALYEAHHRWFRRTLAALRKGDLGAALRAGQRADELSRQAVGMLAFQLRATKCGGGGAETLGLVSAG
jgi:hypothetical protein